MEVKVKERLVKERQDIGALQRVMKRWNVSMELKKGIRNSIIFPTLACIRDMDMKCSTAVKNDWEGVEWLKHGTQRWLEHMMKMEEEDFVKCG